MKRKGTICIVLLLITIVIASCGITLKTEESIAVQFKKEKTTYTIRKDINLAGGNLTIPAGCTLKFQGGRFLNGTVVGNNTRIKYYGEIFDHVMIDGTWNVPILKSTMFSATQSDCLYQLCKLQDDKVFNKILIEKGEYSVNTNTQRAALFIKSNAEVSIDGNIKLESQTNKDFYNGYYVIHVRDARNVKIVGKGIIVGDKDKSRVTGEYGHGICIINSDAVSINDIIIESCNGDGIAVSRNCGDVSISDVRIENFYRNGISVVGGRNITVNNVIVERGGMMSPMAGIDIEPNPGDSVGRVKIRYFTTKNCPVGIAGYVADNSIVEYVDIKNVTITQANIPIDIKKMNRIIMKSIKINFCDSVEYVVRAIGNKDFVMNKVSFVSPNCAAKYPFYIDNEKTELLNSKIECPQIFSFHLKNSTIRNCQFKYNSFIWTAQNILTKNVVAEGCTFDGPLFMRPSNVIFRKSKFLNRTLPSLVPIVFEEATITDENTHGVLFDDNTIQGRKSDGIGVQSAVRNSTVSRNRSITDTPVLYKVTGANTRVYENR